MGQWEEDAGMAGDALGDMSFDEMREWLDKEEALERALAEAAAVGEAPDFDIDEDDDNYE